MITEVVTYAAMVGGLAFIMYVAAKGIDCCVIKATGKSLLKRL